MPSLRILFTHSYILRLDPKQEQWNKPYPPLMTLLAAARVREVREVRGGERGERRREGERERGDESTQSPPHQVTPSPSLPISQSPSLHLFDPQFSPGPEAIFPVLETTRPDILVIFDDGFNYLTKMCLTNMREAAWIMARKAQSLGAKVIVCSSDATDHYRAYLDNGADFVLLGEGEQTLVELVEALQTGRPADTLPGLACKTDGAVKVNPRRALMADLNALPLPAWDLIDLSEYRRRWETHWGYFSLNIATTRGCPYQCNWCAKPIYGNAYKMRSPENVVQEIELLQQTTSFGHIWFCDDIFGLKRSWVMEFAELIRQKEIKIRYKIQSRADLLVKDQYIEALKASGCEEVWMGVESGAQEILDAMDKGITLEEVRTATRKLKENGIRPCFFIQFGYPGETAGHIRQTVDLILELLPHDIGISVSYPLPGTGFYDKVAGDLKKKANWTDSNDLDLMFANTYPPAFYKQLYQYVHRKFRRQHALARVLELLRSPRRLNYPNLKKALSILYYGPAAILAKRRLKTIAHEAAASL